MILFLDSITPLPEFSIVEDNKIFFSKKILNDNSGKMSDYIVKSYIDLNNSFELTKNLKFLITSIGPGSYTALRVGIAFMYGLSIARKIPLIGVSCFDLLKLHLMNKDISSAVMYICSSNNQNYICYYNKDTNMHDIKKIEKNEINLKIKNINTVNIVSNYNLEIIAPSIFNQLNYEKIELKDIVSSKINEILLLPKKNIIKPIYISNNKILR